MKGRRRRSSGRALVVPLLWRGIQVDDVVSFTLDGREEVKRLRDEPHGLTELSTRSPVGKALVGMTEGDVKEVETPLGTFELKVLRVTSRVRR